MDLRLCEESKGDRRPIFCCSESRRVPKEFGAEKGITGIRLSRQHILSEHYGEPRSRPKDRQTRQSHVTVGVSPCQVPHLQMCAILMKPLSEKVKLGCVSGGYSSESNVHINSRTAKRSQQLALHISPCGKKGNN